MSKLTKLVNNPKAFFIDATKKRLSFLQDALDAQLKQQQPKKVAPLIKSEPSRIHLEDQKITENQISDIKHDVFDLILTGQKPNINEGLKNRLNFLLFDVEPYLVEMMKSFWVDDDFNIHLWFPLNEKDKNFQNRKLLEDGCINSPEFYISLIVKKLMPLLNKKVALIFFKEELMVEKLTIIAARKIGIPTILWRDVTSSESFLCDFLVGHSFKKKGGVFAVPENFMADLLFSYQKQKQVSKDLLFDLIDFDQNKKTVYVGISVGVRDSIRSYREYVKNSLEALNEFLQKNMDIQLIVNIDEVNRVFDPNMILDDRLFLNGLKTTCDLDLFQCLSLSDYCFVDHAYVLGLAKAYGCHASLIQKDIKNEQSLPLSEIWIGLLQSSRQSLIQQEGYPLDSFVDQMKVFLKSVVIERYKTLEEKSQMILESPNQSIVYASEFGEKALLTTHKYLTNLLGVDGIKQSNPKLNNMLDLIDVDCFIQWGIKETETKKWQRRVAKIYGKPVLIIEDGFLRSVDIGLSGEPGLSILLDDKTAYYNAKEPSRLECLLQESLVSEEQKHRARQVIKNMVENRISKYNHAPNLKLKIGREGYPKILLIDQRYGDQSVEYGLASEESFDRMLQDAISKYKNHDILIKQHPDAIKGGKSSYFSDEKLRFASYTDNVFPVNFDVNPYSLFDIVDEVFVGTSGMGFEALLAGKKVHCYGAPFYSGWGLTRDHVVVDRRTTARSLEEVFFLSYICMSRYYSPIRERTCTIEELIVDLVSMRGW